MKIDEQIQLIRAMAHGDGESIQVWDIIRDALIVIRDQHEELWLFVNGKRDAITGDAYSRAYDVRPPYRRSLE